MFSRSRDPQIRVELIEHYVPFARMIAAHVYGLRPDRAASFDDYLQYARVGLIEAVDRYDSARSVSFETYSAHRIRGAILNGVGQQSEVAAQRDFWRTRMPERMQSVITETGRSAQRASLQDLIDITIGIALGLVLDEDEGEPIDEATHSNPYAATELEQLSRTVKTLVRTLPDREREVIEWHYFKRQEFQAIAQKYGLSKGRVSQLHGRALTRLRQMLEEQPRIDRKV